MDRLPLFLRIMRRRAQKARKAQHARQARYDVWWEPALPVPAADGSPLLTDHYAPVTGEPCPTVLLRSPYIRDGFPWNYLYGLLFAGQGFHVVLQSSRGTGGSGGEFHPWRNEAADGQATVAWLRAQTWFTGELYTLGPSYLVYSQLALALDPPPEWRGAVMQVGVIEPYRFFWPGGAFALERSLVGGLGLFGTGEKTGTRKNHPARAILRMRLTLKRALRELPLLDAYPRIFGGRRPAFEEWLDHPAAADPYWKEFDLSEVAGSLPVPVSLCTGWWDLAPDQVIEQYTRLRAAGREPDLLIGPWTHTGALGDGWTELFEQAIRRLRGEPSPFRVRIHVGGADEWRDLPDWPPPATERALHLGPGGLESARDTFRYDPRDPTPSIRGALQSPTQGQGDNAALEKRSDVLTFTGPPLPAPLEVIGPVRAVFDAVTTAASGDLFARLCDVDPAGRSVNVCDGLARIEPGGTTVELGPTAHRFAAGHRIRLLVAGGAHPRYLRNYGTGEPPGPATRLVSTDTTVGNGSVLLLPVV